MRRQLPPLNRVQFVQSGLALNPYNLSGYFPNQPARRPDTRNRLEASEMQDKSVVVPSPWLNVEQAAQYIQQHVRSIYRAAGAGELRSVRINGKRELRFRREWIDEWMERHAHGGEDSAPVPAVMRFARTAER